MSVRPRPAPSSAAASVRVLPWLLPLLLGLGGCDQVGTQLGIQTPGLNAAKREADAKATGAACRHAGRAIEDCYSLNPRLDRAAIYTGWREMNEYMTENKIEPISPVVPPPPPEPTEEEKAAAAEEKASAARAAKAAEAKARKEAARKKAEAEENGEDEEDTESAPAKSSGKAAH
ncbi:MAG: hypothetical protein RLY78_18 [Pseudomonadota bacterium]